MQANKALLFELKFMLRYNVISVQHKNQCGPFLHTSKIWEKEHHRADDDWDYHWWQPPFKILWIITQGCVQKARKKEKKKKASQ